MIPLAKCAQYLNAVEERSLNRCFLPGVGHILGRSPTRDEYRASIQAVWGSDDPSDEEIEIAQRLENMLRILDSTPQRLKEDR